MSQNKSATPFEFKKILNALKKLDTVLIILIIIGAWFFSQIVIKNPNLESLFDKIGNIPDFLTLFPIFSSSLLIGTWFLYRGKSVKSLNDIILFFSVSYALYLFLFNNKEYEKLNSINEVVSNLSLFSAKIVILNCSIAKTIITLFEFIIERIKENTERKIILQKKQNTEEDTESASSAKGAKEEWLELNYKYEKKQEDKIEHEEFSFLKFENDLKKEGESSVAKASKGSADEIKTKPPKDKLTLTLVLISLFFLASPFLYSAFIHFHH